VRAIWRARPPVRPEWESSLGDPSSVMLWDLTSVSQADASFPISFGASDRQKYEMGFMTGQVDLVG
jgi:hypothetical protein